MQNLGLEIIFLGAVLVVCNAIKLIFTEDRVNMVRLSTIREMFGQFKDVSSISFLVLRSFFKGHSSYISCYQQFTSFLAARGTCGQCSH